MTDFDLIGEGGFGLVWSVIQELYIHGLFYKMDRTTNMWHGAAHHAGKPPLAVARGLYQLTVMMLKW